MEACAPFNGSGSRGCSDIAQHPRRLGGGLPGATTVTRMLLFLVRHAQAVPRGKWEGPDRDRPLNSRGLRQAKALASRIGDRLDGEPPPLIVSSPTLRCRETVAPLAGRYGVTVDNDDRLVEIAHVDEADRPGPDAATGWLADRLSEVIDEALERGGDKGGIVVCSHGEVLPPGVSRLVEDLDVATAAKRNDKGGFWVIDLGRGRNGRSEYVSAP